MNRLIAIFLLLSFRVLAVDVTLVVREIYPEAKFLLDYVGVEDGDTITFSFWATNRIGPYPTPLQLQVAISNVAASSAIGVARLQIESEAKSNLLASVGTSDISYALLSANAALKGAVDSRQPFLSLNNAISTNPIAPYGKKWVGVNLAYHATNLQQVFDQYGACWGGVLCASNFQAETVTDLSLIRSLGCVGVVRQMFDPTFCITNASSNAVTTLSLARYNFFVDVSITNGFKNYIVFSAGDRFGHANTNVSAYISILTRFAASLGTRITNVIGIDLVAEAPAMKSVVTISDAAMTNYLGQIYVAARALFPNTPLTCSAALTAASDINDSGVVAVLGMSQWNYMDIHTYYGPDSSLVSDVSSMVQRFGKDFFIGEFGASLVLSNDVRAARYAANREVHSMANCRGSMSWAVRDQITNTPAECFGLFDETGAERTEMTRVLKSFGPSARGYVTSQFMTNAGSLATTTYRYPSNMFHVIKTDRPVQVEVKALVDYYNPYSTNSAGAFGIWVVDPDGLTNHFVSAVASLGPGGMNGKSEWGEPISLYPGTWKFIGFYGCTAGAADVYGGTGMQITVNSISDIPR